MISIKLLQKILLSLCIVFTYISCEVLEEETASTVTYNSAASFVSKKEVNKKETKNLIQGDWYSSKSGDKHKWSFNGLTLSKSTIYSFGEAGVPQIYNVQFLNGFKGQADDYGDYVYLSLESSDKGICYQLSKNNANEIILNSKYGDKITLKK